MIKIIDKKNDSIFYECGCGAKGVCALKSQIETSFIVIDVKCPICSDVERLTLLKYDSEESKKRMLEKFRVADLSWVPIVNEELIDKE